MFAQKQKPLLNYDFSRLFGKFLSLTDPEMTQLDTTGKKMFFNGYRSHQGNYFGIFLSDSVMFSYLVMEKFQCQGTMSLE